MLFFSFCRSIRNTEQGINESCLMSTAWFYNRLVLKGFFFFLSALKMGVRGWRGWRCTCEERPLGNICLSCPQTDDYLQIFEMPTDTWAWSHVPFFFMGRYVRTNGNIIVCTSCHLQVAPWPPYKQSPLWFTQPKSPLWFTQPKRNHSTSTEFSLDSERTAQVCVRLEWWNHSQQRLTLIYSQQKQKKQQKKQK